ncbi:hypothetical protein KC363_g8373 [Hortaea werneckii]|nr:hypothetical protein KC325_g5851 [Hortaea werneckii]KAI6986478.1 hypothetical protein KC359_g8731 [Hortaea werneckii]KAI7143989.1 hypothetical protein KC344_g5773 [Hortaea werneckii]KAI7167681.1 hypothetical protein KC360_g8502 [Hortaea werneckii]KAI7183181.1 hypothetical protein KC363_g8373 [Hortaea werneckii]
MAATQSPYEHQTHNEINSTSNNMGNAEADIASAIDALLAPPPPRDTLAATGQNLFPMRPAAQIFLLPDDGDGKRILKAGLNPNMSEANAMRFVAQRTSIPVPRVIDTYTFNGRATIVMSHLPGVQLARIWDSMNLASRSRIIVQLQDIISQLSALRGSSYSTLWEQPCEDIFFKHFPAGQRTIPYGPFATRAEYNQGLIEALKRSHPSGKIEASDSELVCQLLQSTDEDKVFSHGDLHLGNIMVDEDTATITGLLDWGAAGFSIRGREYYEANSRARRRLWIEALDTLFPENEKAHFGLLDRLDNALIRYTFI